MKLGRDTGSLTNYLMSGTKGQPIPEVGMGVTFLSWTDRHAGTIHDVFEEGEFLFIRCTTDKAIRTDKNGFSEQQEYQYIPQPEGHSSYYRRPVSDPNAPFQSVKRNEKSGRGQRKWLKGGDLRIRIGEREEYWDPNF